MKALSLLMIVALGLQDGLAVDRNNFKTCDQSGFCKRLRGFKPEKSQYTLNVDSVFVHGNVLSAEVVTVDYDGEKKNILWRYALRLSALADGTFRVEMDEADPLYPRYRTQIALQGEPKGDGLKLISNENGKLTLANNQGHSVVVTTEPLKIEFLDHEGEVAVVLNENSQLVVEPLRARREKISDDDEQGNNVEVQEEEGAWGENFKGHHDSKPRGNEAVSLDVSFPGANHVYGIPEHTDNFYLKTTTSGEPYRLYNLDVFEYELDSPMAIYGAVPVLYSHSAKRSSGVFWHNSAETWVDIVNYSEGTVVSSLVNFVTGGQKQRVDARFMSESGVVDIFVLLGARPADVFRQYTALTGVAPVPPKFSLAYHQSRWNYMDEADVRSVDEGFDEHDIPADCLWLDIEYTDKKKYFTWDAERFAHPTEMVANLTAKGRKLVVIIDPHIKREAGYFVHEDCTERGYYVKNKDGNDYEGWCWPGSSSYPDFFNPEVIKYYVERYRFENFPGTSKDVHIWNDMNEPSVFNGPEITMPKDCRHYKPPQDGQDGLSAYWEHRHVHNEYGQVYIRATHEGMLARTDHKYRPFILTRSTFAGTQRFAAVWTGDNAAEWGFLQASVPMCLSLASAGISFCGSDVGGFFKYPDAELMTRWYQAGAYQAFFRAHSHIETKRREPWLYDATTLARIRDAVRRRYALLDLWRSSARTRTSRPSAASRGCTTPPRWRGYATRCAGGTRCSTCGEYVPGVLPRALAHRDQAPRAVAVRRHHAGADTRRGAPAVRAARLVVSTYQAFFRAHSHIETKRREPWLYDATTLARIRDAVRRRYALLDLWYTLFYEHMIDGLPVTRPLFQEFPTEEATFTIDNQYLLGDKLLIRPVLEQGASSVKVYLPGKESATVWYDVDTYQAVAANGWTNVDVTITKIPVYQRGGSIVPRKERIRRSSALMANDPYTLVVALDSNNTATGTLYIDDGESFDYQTNKYIYARLRYEAGAMTYTFINPAASYPTRSWVERVVIAGIKNAPKSAKLVQGGKQAPLQMTLHRGNDVLVVRKPAASMAAPWEIQFAY